MGKRTSSSVFCFFYMCAFIWSIFKNLTFVTLVTYRILTCDKFRILKTSIKSIQNQKDWFSMYLSAWVEYARANYYRLLILLLANYYMFELDLSFQNDVNSIILLTISRKSLSQTYGTLKMLQEQVLKFTFKQIRRT